MEKIIFNEEDIPKTYLNGVWEKEIYIDEENLYLHSGMDQSGYKTYTYIDTAQTQWQKENPKKSIFWLIIAMSPFATSGFASFASSLITSG